MSARPKSNDAVPTWSGFNYQGKIALLSALIEINYLLDNKIKITDEMYIEIEKTEDFIVYRNGIAQSLNQVKAYLSSTRFSSYTEAMGKLLTHRSDINALTAKCNLCTALDITNWSDATNTYSSSISLFKYENRCVSITQAPLDIKKEIDKLMNKLSYVAYVQEDIYLGVCDLLDTKITLMHEQGTKKRNYKLLMSDILSCIDDTYNNKIRLEIAREKERVYIHIVTNFKQSIDDYCASWCDSKQLGVCKKDLHGFCSVPQSYDFMLNLNIWEYCKLINPHINKGWEDIYNYIANMSTEKFINQLVPIFYEIKETMLKCDDAIYCDTDMYLTHLHKVIPTMLSFYSPSRKQGLARQEALKGIKENSGISSSVSGCAITADTAGNVFNTEEDSILHIKHMENGNIKNLENSIKIVDNNDFIERLGNVK